jgi:hypothetical protein
MDEARRVGPAELTWDRDRRLARLGFVEEGVGGRTEAETLVSVLAGWTADEEPYALLVDCSQMLDADAAWRTTWGEHFKRNRDQATIAWFDANARVRLIILMFRKGTGVHGRAFATEDEALRWLEESGAVR